ncbi:MAG: hypothetical protein NT004_10495 [Bacteroidetes bacterium]|nr:hypothetical protein [Bacteroidota bacterium]
METLVIKPKTKQSIPFLKRLLSSLSDVESVQVVSDPKERIVKSIKSGLKESMEIISGKKKGKTIQQLIDED